MEAISAQQEKPHITSAVDKQRYAEQVTLLYRNAPLTFAITLANGFMLCWVQRLFISVEILLGWFLCILLLTAARSILVHRYFRMRPDLGDAARWGRYYLIATALSGMLWGSTALFLYPTESTTHQVVIAIVLVGMSAGAVPMLSSIREVFWVFLLPAMLPLAMRLLMAGNELTTVLGVMTILFIAGMLISSQRMNRSIVNSLSLGFENRNLFVQLEKDKAETDRLNTVLLAQIAERSRVEQALRVHELELRDLTDKLEQRVEERTRELWMEIEERKRAENTLRQRSRALQQSGSSVLIVNKNGVIEYANPRFIETTDYSTEELFEKKIQVLDCANGENMFSIKLSEAMRSGCNWRGEIQMRKKNGEHYWSLLSISPMQEESGTTTHLVVVGEDLTQLKETQAQMEQLAFYDPLTGLANRRLFRDRLEQSLRTLPREHQPLALLHLDVDHFKRINDTLGHDAGDLLLQTVAQRLVDCVRQQDTVARLGGDEFFVILKGVDGPTDAGQVARKILASLREPIRLATHEVIVTTSLGITVAPGDGLEATQLMKNADLAMYRAKQLGRNTYHFFVEDMNRVVPASVRDPLTSG